MHALKIAGGLLLLVCGALGGLYFAERAKKRLAFLEAYEAFLQAASSLVSSCEAELSQILEFAVNNDYLHDIGSSAKRAIENGTDPRIIWKKTAAQTAIKGEICTDDIELISGFADYDGEEDSTARAGKITFLLDRTRQRLSALKKETDEKRRLYRILGTFVGALAAAILI